MLRSTGVALAEPLDTGPLVRERFSFDPDGRYAACLAGDGGSGLAVEMWTFIHRESRRILPTLGGETLRTQPVPTGDGRVLLLRNGSGLHHLVLLEPDADGARERAVACLEAPGVRLIPSPDPGTLALAVASHVDRTTVWRIPATHPQLERLLEVPGSFGGGLWLDGAGRVLGVNRRVHDRVVPAFADLHRGSLSVLPTVSASSNDHLLLSSPRSGRTLVASDAAGELRLGLGVLDGSAPVRFPAALNRLAGTAEPLAFDPAGQQVALKVNRGARSDLLVYEAGADRIREVAIPAGTIRGVGSWGWSGLRFPFSAPDQPTGLGTVDGIGSWSVSWEMSEQLWKDMIDINLTGVFNTVRSALPSMVERGEGGSVVLTSSTAGLIGYQNTAHYTAAKHGVIGLMKVLAQELGQHRIRVNAICPTTVNTPLVINEATFELFAPGVEHPGPDDVRGAFSGLNILPDVPWIEPSDVSEAVAWLCSDAARYITGIALPIDAGNTVKKG